jgi:2-polyprenyl-3-methyl-5-hydroxy-6-metoxy-1,4-benzoquinol methylase
MGHQLHTDVFGDALLDYEAGRHGRMLKIRRDDDHVDLHDPALYFVEAPFEHEVSLLKHTEGRVLDVGCGAGRTLLWLQRRGMRATGIDLSPGAIEVCRRRGCEDVSVV